MNQTLIYILEILDSIFSLSPIFWFSFYKFFFTQMSRLKLFWAIGTFITFSTWQLSLVPTGMLYNLAPPLIILSFSDGDLLKVCLFKGKVMQLICEFSFFDYFINSSSSLFLYLLSSFFIYEKMLFVYSIGAFFCLLFRIGLLFLVFCFSYFNSFLFLMPLNNF